MAAGDAHVFSGFSHTTNNTPFFPKPVTWKEYCAKYGLKELQESMDSCTGRRDIFEILLKKALNYTINQSFQNHRLLFSHASAEVRGENTRERKYASTWDQTRNHQVKSPTRSPLSHPGGAARVIPPFVKQN